MCPSIKWRMLTLIVDFTNKFRCIDTNIQVRIVASQSQIWAPCSPCMVPQHQLHRSTTDLLKSLPIWFYNKQIQHRIQ